MEREQLAIHATEVIGPRAPTLNAEGEARAQDEQVVAPAPGIEPAVERGDAAAPRKLWFPHLDGLRTFAFLAVFVSHAFHHLPPLMHHATPRLGFLADRVVNLGEVGVSFFFVLSGFLITYLVLRETAETGRLSLLAFYTRRVLRIWPLYYAALVFPFVVYPIISLRWLGHATHVNRNPVWYVLFLSNFDFIRSKNQGGVGLTPGITWSVAVEEQFYLVWPLLLAAFTGGRRMMVFCAIIVGSWIFRFCHASDAATIYFHTASVISDLAVGGLVAELSFSSSTWRSWFGGLKRWHIGAVYLVGATALVLAYNFSKSPTFVASQRLLFSMWYAFILMEQMYCQQSLWKMGRIRWATFLGRYTYGLYLLHPVGLMLVIVWAIRCLPAPVTGLAGMAVTGSLGLLITIAIAIGSYHGFEQPFLRLKERFRRA